MTFAYRIAVVAGLTALVWLGSTATPARAQDAAPAATQAARDHYRAGTTHYNLGRFDEAVSEYRKAYEIKADPVFIYNIAQSYRQLGRSERALFFYRRFLSMSPETPHRQQVEEHIADLEKRVAEENATGVGDHDNATPTEPESVPAPLPSAPSASPTPDNNMMVASQNEATDEDKPVWKKTWFWVAAGAVVVGVVAVGLLAAGGGDGNVPRTDLGNAKLVF